jgi:hypothetical protein
MTTMLLMAATAFAQQPVQIQRVADDAMVIDRVGEASKRDLPRDLLKRIVSDDIDVLRGKRQDGTFQYATYERFEAGRITESFSIQPRKDKMQTVEIKGSFVYRLVIDVPSRRLVVRKNLPIWIERVDIEMVPENKSQTDRQSIDVKAWLQPGEIKPVDLPSVARQATIHVIAAADPKGYGNLDLSLVQARIVDNADSPYVNAVSSAKAIQRALDNGDIPSLRAMAQRMRDSLGAPPRAVAASAPAPAASTVNVTAALDSATQVEMQAELQMIEDLLTGSDSERREGLDRLHQLIRHMRR